MSKTTALFVLFLILAIPLTAQQSFQIHAAGLFTSDGSVRVSGNTGFTPLQSISSGWHLSAQWVSKIRLGAVASFLWLGRAVDNDRFYVPSQELRHKVESAGVQDFSLLAGPSYHLLPEDKRSQIELSVLAGYRSLSLGRHIEQYISVNSYKFEQLHYEFEQQSGWIIMPGILIRSQPEGFPVGIMGQLSRWWSSSQQQLSIASADGQQRTESFLIESAGVAVSVGLTYTF